MKGLKMLNNSLWGLYNFKHAFSIFFFFYFYTLTVILADELCVITILWKLCEANYNFQITQFLNGRSKVWALVFSV